MTDRLVVDLFAGPGGWSEGLRALGLEEVGLEWDDAACRTARAAGHARVRCDVARFPLDRLYGLWLLIGSPPCRMFSAAGSGAGKLLMAELASAIRDAFAGRPTLSAHRKRMVRVLQAAYLTNPATRDLPRARRSALAWAQVMDAALVVQPARFIHATRPAYVALEQVPGVLPLWHVYVHELRKAGYDARAALLHAEQYGVPQTRTRAFLAASRDGAVRLPEPTHARYRKGEPRDGEGTLFGLLPPVSMAEALGWADDVTAVSNYGTGGDASNRGVRSGGEPASTVTSKVGQVRLSHGARRDEERGAWAFAGAGSAAERTAGQRPRGLDEPAHTVTGKDNTANAAERAADEPAPTLFFSARMNACTWQERPSPTVVTTRRSRQLPEGEGRNVGGWGYERPATTVVGSFGADIISPPGYRTDVSRQNAEGGVRVTLAEASILQGFRPDYPWAGSRSKQFEQVGNAVPPPLACAVVGALLGLDWRSALSREVRRGAA